MATNDEDRARSDAILALGAGLLGGQGTFGMRAGQGLHAALGTYNASLDSGMKRRYMQSQMDENASQAELRKMQVASQQRQQALVEQWMREGGLIGGPPTDAGGAGPVPGAPPGASATMPSDSIQIDPNRSTPPIIDPRTQRPGLPPGVNRQAMAADLAFNGGKGVGGMINDATKPNIQYQSGVPVNLNQPLQNLPTIPQVERNGMGYQLVRQPDGSFAVQAPAGALETFGAYKDRERQAEAAGDIVTVTGQDGVTRQMTRAQQLQQLNGGQPPAAPRPASAPLSPAPAGPQQQASPETYNRVLQDEFQRVAADLESGDPNRMLKARSEMSVLEAEAKRRGVPLRATMPTGPAQQQAPGMRVQSAAEAAGAKATAEGQAKRFVDMEAQFSQSAAQAPIQLARLDRMEQLLSGVGGGKLSPYSREVQSVLSSMGIKVGENLGAAQAAEAIAIGMANGMRQPGTGVMTDKDFENFKAQIPDLSKTPEGRAQITATMRTFLQREQQEAGFAQKYLSKYGRLDNAFEQQLNQWRAANPVRF